MKNSYLKVFDNLFYDVNKNDNVKMYIEQASAVFDLLITKFGEIENEMAAGTSRIDNFTDVVIILFIRKIMEQLDAINVLYSEGIFVPAQIILRSLVENIVEVEFILKEDTRKRAAAYFLERHYQELDREKDFKGEDLEVKKQALERVIKSKEVFKEIDTDRKEKLEKKRKRRKSGSVYIQWYEVCSNITSFRGLMKAVGYEKYYDDIYGSLSLETHGLNVTMEMMVNKDGILSKCIRNPVGGDSTFKLACAFSVGVLQKICKYLKDGKDEIDEFRIFFADFTKKRDIAMHNLSLITNC